MIVLPVMLFAYMLSGINQNVAMWYKLASKTKIALIVTLAGLITSITINVLFMPVYSYRAAAWGHVASYSVMIFISWQLSKRYYKIPYQWNSIMLYLFLGIVLFFVNSFMETPSILLNLILYTVLLLLFIVFVVIKEKIFVRKKKTA
jgi:O-antigen/teichoic acid export membrane protein